jgi:peptide/nickel transport system substrate-binding protein
MALSPERVFEPMRILARVPIPVAAAFLLAATACEAPDGERAPVGDPETGGNAVVAMSADFQTLNPVPNSSLTSLEVMNFMLYTPLVRYDANLDVEPYLAESWDLQDDHVVFTLRDDVRWHDGEPVTAEDVVFTFELAMNPEAAAPLLPSAFMGMIESATVIDERTVRFDFVAPHAQALEGFAWPPVPQHLLGETAAGEIGQAGFNRRPVGSGPFRFVSWDANERLVLEANPDFPEGLGGRPRLDRVTFRIIPEATTRLTELVNRSIDVNYSVHPEEGVQIDRQGGVDLMNYPGREFTYIGWNIHREPFTDARTRRAMTMAINRPEIMDGLLFGYADPASGPIPPWSPMDPGVDPLPYDPDQARQLLEEAGWQPGPDGILRRNGQALSFRMMVNANNTLHRDIATVVQQQLRQVGAQMELQSLEFQSMLGRHRERDFQAVLSNWILDTFRVDPSPLFSCAEAEREQSANRSGYCNPQADAAIERGLRATGEGEARSAWGDFNQVLQDDQPFTFMYWTEDLAGIGPRIEGVEMDSRSKLVNVHQWWIPSDRRR